MKILEGQVTLWETFIGNDWFNISLSYPKYDMEGELALAFNANGQELFIMSFAIIPGSLMRISDDPTIFITEVKGERRQFELIRHATRLLNDITPPVMLATAVQAFATALKMTSIIGIGANDQMSVSGKRDPGRCVSTYDELWVSLGGRRLNDRAFSFAAAPEEKPITMIKVNHRCRTNRKRQFKKGIFTDIVCAVQEKCLR